MIRRQTQDLDVLLVSMVDASARDLTNVEALRTLVVGSSVSVKIQTPWENTLYQVCRSSCDGLICLYGIYNSGIVVNPTTRWHRAIPLSNYQLISNEIRKRDRDLGHTFPGLGFGKDKLRSIYKPVWLYNSLELGLDEATTCEVFDFSTNAWRKVIPASPCRVLAFHDPIYFDGSLHWFTDPYEGETNVLSLDLHTETFQVICKAPFVVPDSPTEINMCTLNNCLCVSLMDWPEQKIWSFNAEEETWQVIYSIDLVRTFEWFRLHMFALTPLAVLGKNKLLLNNLERGIQLVIHDPRAGSYDLVFNAKASGYTLCYFQSLISIL
ncbi:unnamed protein product [Thlaspi arvense]|uniref:F-box associated beta-propeller type 1 domain-containing protein n=1 Tax=Thlaspi arvense TaxID=13288 RepID=A0AAU9R761_THLAR|nr:unnamed protein product [Thlaspi arvense]